jgi:hypothetical protein
MVDAAEIAWHHGIDLYRHNDSIFKYMFDFPILMSYPDFTTPAENDSHRVSMLECPYPAMLKHFGATPNCYEYAYLRYRDPSYLPVINNSVERAYLANLTALAQPSVPGAPAPSPRAPGTPPPAISQRHLNLTKVGVIPPSLLYDLDPAEGKTILATPSVNYPVVGFGILRIPAADGSGNQSLILSYGASASHGHPDKLHIDLYALNELLMPSPGVSFPYQDVRLPKWYKTTLAHNTLTVDEKLQDYLGANPKTKARADQTVFAPASTVGLNRGWTDSVYPGVTMDRALFMTTNYLADIFGAFSSSPHKYDLAWHIRGAATSELTFKPIQFDPNVNGYNWFTGVRAADSTDKPWRITSTRDTHVARLYVAGGSATQAIIGEGGIYVDETSKEPGRKPTAPTIIERRENCTTTVYGNALDYSGSKEGYVKGVTQEGGINVGYALLNVTTTAGTDRCFAAYRPGIYTAGNLRTDGLQAFVGMNGNEPKNLYLAGGKFLSVGSASITRSEPGLAYVEKTLEGNYIVGNPSPTDGTLTVALPALKGLEAFALDANNQKGAPVVVKAEGGAISLPLKAGARVLFARK